MNARRATLTRLELRPFPLAGALALLAGERGPDWHAEFPADGDIEAATNLRLQAGADADPDAYPLPFGPRLVVLDGVVVGMVGVTRGPDERGAVEVGYGVVAAVRRRGVATRALMGLLDELRECSVRRVVARTDRDNVASQGVLARAGFRIVGEDARQVLWETEITS